MSRTLVTMAPEATVAEAATVMAQRKVGSVLVLDGDRLVAIFTERDIVRAVSSDAAAPTHRISDWMTRSPQTIRPQASLEEARAEMLAGQFRHLPVLEGDRLVGMLSMRDVAASGQ